MRKLHFHPCGNFKERYEQETTIFETDFGRLWACVGIFFLFFVIPFISSPYLIHVLNIIGISSIAAIGLNILIGSTGLISLGHGAFIGVGAYSAAILSTRLEVPFLLTLPLAGAITSMVGMIFGLPSVRLKGLYLAISTLAGQFIIEYVLIQWESLTRGAMGILIPSPSFLGYTLRSDLGFFYVIYLSLSAMVWFAMNIFRSKFGRAFIAIRDNERAAEGMGIVPFQFKLLSFGISSFYAGFAGALWGYYMASITPEPFNLFLSVEYIAMVIIGGLGSIAGGIYGAVFIIFLNETLRWIIDYFMNTGLMIGAGLTIAPLREFVFGLAIVLFILFEPRGIVEVWRFIRSSFKKWPFSY